MTAKKKNVLRWKTKAMYAYRNIEERSRNYRCSGKAMSITYCELFTFCWPCCISVYLSQYLTNLMHNIFFHNKFYFMPLHVSSTCDHHQEVKIVLHSLWYRHTYRCDDTRGCVMQFWPPDDDHMGSKHVEAWNKTYCETNFVHQVG